ncbi:MAG: SIR2 family protein [Candidatus Anammoxibacter sp.]
MRKVIFKNEIHYYFERYDLEDGIRHNLLKSLFEDPLNTSKQYLLNKNVKNVEDIGTLVEKVINDHRFVGDVKTLFLIDDDLELPQELREQLIRKEKIAVFVGSGISKLLGFPLWDELAVSGINYLYTSGLMNFDEMKKILRESISPKQKLSIFHNILPKGSEGNFYKNHFAPSKHRRKRNPYDLLVKLPFPKFTLNLDGEFWNALVRLHKNNKKEKTKSSFISGEADIKHIFKEFKEDIELDDAAIYQVHGFYKNLKNYSIVTMRDYLDHYYGDGNTGLRDFLKKVFNEYAVIFLGVGLEEFELLQYLVRSKKKHHVLISTYINDTNLLRFKKEYFKKALGIDAHGYYLDFNGYDRLYDVIKAWVNQINKEIYGGFYDKTGEFDNVEL